VDFDWLDAPFDLKEVTPREIEESFEDPFSIRLLPDEGDWPESRFFLLGKSLASRPLFNVFWTNGKQYRVIFSREMTPEESTFYDRKNAEFHF